jgi:hypothetical protein
MYYFDRIADRIYSIDIIEFVVSVITNRNLRCIIHENTRWEEEECRYIHHTSHKDNNSIFNNPFPCSCS